MTTREKRDIHAEITAKIIATIEANPGAVRLPRLRPNAPLVLPVNRRLKIVGTGAFAPIAHKIAPCARMAIGPLLTLQEPLSGKPYPSRRLNRATSVTRVHLVMAPDNSAGCHEE